MASLSYHSQHLAWQQRVRKEQSVASEFSKCAVRRTFDSFRLTNCRQSQSRSHDNSFPARRSIRTSHRKTQPVKTISQSPVKPRPPPEDDFEAELRRRAKEVRGKYSRPVVPINGTLQFTDSVLTKRPVTSGSLVPSHRGPETSPEKKKPPSVSESETPRAHLRTRSLVYRRRSENEELRQSAQAKAEQTASPPAEEKPQADEQGEKNEEKTPEAADVGAEAAETEPLADAEVQADLQEGEDAKSTVSWLTSKSQQRYIDELEQLLKTERLVTPTQKRIIAEEKLAAAQHAKA